MLFSIAFDRVRFKLPSREFFSRFFSIPSFFQRKISRAVFGLQKKEIFKGNFSSQIISHVGIVTKRYLQDVNYTMRPPGEHNFLGMVCTHQAHIWILAKFLNFSNNEIFYLVPFLRIGSTDFLTWGLKSIRVTTNKHFIINH